MTSEDDSAPGLASLGLQDRLLEVAVIVGMDEETGLHQRRLNRTTTMLEMRSLFEVHFQGHLLDILSGPQHANASPHKESAAALWRQSLKQITTKKNDKTQKPRKLLRAKSVRKLRKKANNREEVPVSTDFLSNLPCICLPEDSRVYRTQPKPHFHSTVLTDIAGFHHYAAVLTFYKQYYAAKQPNGDSWELTTQNPTASQESSAQSSTEMCFVPCCVCLVSMKPYIEVLKDCLSCFYKELTFASANSFRRLLEKYVTNLSLVVVPPPFIKVRFSFGTLPIVLSPPDEPLKLEHVVDIDLRLPLFIFMKEPSVLLSILACILLERRVVFLSEDYSLLPLVMQCFFTYIQPMEWHHQYIPILFSEIIGFVDCPGIFMMGCHSKHKMEIEKVENDLFLVDLDNSRIYTNSPSSSKSNDGFSGQFALQMPGFAVESLLRRLSELQLHNSVASTCGINPVTAEEMKEQNMERRNVVNRKIQNVFMEFMVDLYGTTLQFLDHERHQFKSHEFLESLQPVDSPFYIKAVKSYMFRRFMNQRLHQTADEFSRVAQLRSVRRDAMKMQQRRAVSRIQSMDVLAEYKLNRIEAPQKFASAAVDYRHQGLGEHNSLQVLAVEENGDNSLFSDSNIMTDHFAKPDAANFSPCPQRRASEPPEMPTTSNFSLKARQPMFTLTLPTFPVQGTNFNAKHFYRRCIGSINEALEKLKVESKLHSHQNANTDQFSLRAGLLLLRGFYKLAEESLVNGLEDLYATAKEDARFFPKKIIQKVVQSLSNSEIARIEKHSLYKVLPTRKAVSSKSISTSISHLNTYFKEDDTALCPLKKEPFTYVLEKNDVTSSEKVISLLFQALSENSSTNEVDPENFNAFYQTWRLSKQYCETARNGFCLGIRIPQDNSGGKSSDDTDKVLTFHTQERVLKVSGTVSSNHGSGRLVLTTRRILFISAGNQECKVVIRLQEILIVQIGKLKNFISSSVALNIRYQHDSSVPFKVGLKSECELWLHLINEMQTGQNLSRDQKDHMVSSNTAAQNVMIADAFYTCAKEEDFLKLPDAMAWVGRMCIFEQLKQSGQLESFSPETSEMLVMRMDPSPKESKKTGIRSMIYSAAGINEIPHIWVALGSGKLRLIDTTQWNLDPIPIKDWNTIPKCMCLVHKKELWVGTDDGTIYVLLTATMKMTRILNDHSTTVIGISVMDGNTVVSASRSGEIIVWNSEPTKVHHKFNVLSDPHLLVDFMPFRNNFCCCSAMFLLICDIEGNSLHRLTLGEFSTNAVNSDLSCCAWDGDDELWAADSRGAIYVWDCSSITRKSSNFSSFHLSRTKSKEEQILRPKFSGIVSTDVAITCMEKHGGKVWLGNSNGEIHVLNASNACQERVLKAHHGPVTSLCQLENRYMVSGSGGDDGKVIVWRQ